MKKPHAIWNRALCTENDARARRAWQSGILAGLALVMGASTARGQSLGDDNPNRFSLSYRMGFNISAQFKHLGGYSPTPAAGFNYDNGFVYADQTGASHPGYTWNYGYTGGTAQRPAEAPTDFDLTRTTSSAGATSKANSSDPQPGFELTYNRRLGRFGRCAWGLEAAFSYMDVSIRDDSTVRANATRLTDTYRTGGGAILNPAQPNGFFGNPQGPAAGDANGWPLVGLSPVASRTDTIPGGVTISGYRDLDAHILGFRLGPYVEVPVGVRWNFSLSAGLSLLEVFSDFAFDETVTLDPSLAYGSNASQRQHASGSHNDLLLGVYVGGTASYSFNDHWRVFAGVQFQSAGRYTQTLAGQQAVLDLGQTIFVPVGVSFSF